MDQEEDKESKDRYKMPSNPGVFPTQAQLAQLTLLTQQSFYNATQLTQIAQPPSYNVTQQVLNHHATFYHAT